MVSIIAAVARGGVIGGGNALLWHISEDLKHFKAVTLGHPVVMGRKTFQSLGRPLPGRTNVVVTRDASFRPEGVTVVGSPEQALAMFDPRTEVFIIGGGQIYAQCMPLADRLYLTSVEADFEGDTFFPEIDERQWRMTSCERFERGEKFPSPFSFALWERIR